MGGFYAGCAVCKPCKNARSADRIRRLKAEDPERLKRYALNYEQRNQKEAVCPTCRTTFMARRRGDPQRAPWQVYCSISCGKKKPNPKRRKPKVALKCLACGVMFDCYPCWIGRRKFCSRSCADDWMQTASDYIYGPTWPRQRRRALERDRHTCQHCGVSGITLHVHHKNPYRVSKSNALRNLVSLCPSCHTTEEHRLRSLEDRSGEQLRLRGSGAAALRARRAA